MGKERKSKATALKLEAWDMTNGYTYIGRVKNPTGPRPIFIDYVVSETREICNLNEGDLDSNNNFGNNARCSYLKFPEWRSKNPLYLNPIHLVGRHVLDPNKKSGGRK